MKKLAGALTLVVTLLVQVCLAAISVDTSGIDTSGSPATSQTVNLTVASNSNKLMLGGYGSDQGSDFADSFTFNGDALTRNSGSEVQTDGTFATAGIWYRLEPDVAGGGLVVNFPASYSAGVCGLALFGVDQMSTIRDSDETHTAGSTATTLNLTLTTVSGDYVFYVIYTRGSGVDPGALDHTAGSATGETEIGEVQAVASENRFSCAYAVATGATTNIGYSWPTNARAALVAASIAPATAATTGTDMSLIGVGR